ncbi:hypothetical protein PVAP13_4NG260611 [Panicum virgatum]|uniref:Uncharacterized protein n=1 Tax=Panicum virgatum TaxID=38727 RepID=A0A8T0TEY4_PANVG|nr:hypothetical protein PVAP13_4NG260611 [Panicum virgatum]
MAMTAHRREAATAPQELGRPPVEQNFTGRSLAGNPTFGAPTPPPLPRDDGAGAGSSARRAKLHRPQSRRLDQVKALTFSFLSPLLFLSPPSLSLSDSPLSARAGIQARRACARCRAAPLPAPARCPAASRCRAADAPPHLNAHAVLAAPCPLMHTPRQAHGDAPPRRRGAQTARPCTCRRTPPRHHRHALAASLPRCCLAARPRRRALNAHAERHGHPRRRRPASPARAPSSLLTPSLRLLARAARVPARPHPIPHANAPPLRLERPAPPRPHSRPPSYGSRGGPRSALLHPHRAPNELHFTPKPLPGPPNSTRRLPVPRNTAAAVVNTAGRRPPRNSLLHPAPAQINPHCSFLMAP